MSLSNNPVFLAFAGLAGIGLGAAYGLQLTGRQVAWVVAAAALPIGLLARAHAYGPRTVNDVMDAEAMLRHVAADEQG